MATEFSKVEIINAALLAQGQEMLSSENDGSIQWITLSKNWPSIVEAELEDGQYHFTREEVALETRVDGKFGFDDAYLVPADALHVRRVFTEDTSGRRTLLDFVQDDAYVHVDEPDGVSVEYLVCPDISAWSPLFVRGIQLRMEAVILRAFKEEFQEAAALDSAAEYTLARARTSSSNARSQTEFFKQGGRFTDARHRRGAR